MIALDDLGLQYQPPAGEWALRSVTMNVAAGEFVAIVGPSGCGKSSLLRMIAGLRDPTCGELMVGGQSPRGHRKAAGVGLVFQEPRLLPWLNVRRNIALPLELMHAASPEIDQRVDDSLAMIGLDTRDGLKLPAMLSGGMRMRVALARALITRPDTLLLDEPFAALDEWLREQLNEELLRIWAQRRPTTVFVTHQVSEAVFLSQRVVVMSGRPGRVHCVVEVPWQYPRAPSLRTDTRYFELVAEVSSGLREAVV